MNEKTKIYWLCEKLDNMQPFTPPRYLAEHSWVVSRRQARRFTTKQECSDQCPPGFFPTEHHD